MKIIRRATAVVAGLGLAAASLLSALPAQAAVVGTTTIDFVSDSDTEFSAVSADGSTIALSYYSADEIILLDTASNTVTTVSDPNSDIDSPGGVAFSPDGSTLYLANYASGAGEILVIDVATAAITDQFSDNVLAGPWTLGISPDGNTLFIGDYTNDTFVTYDITGNSWTSDDSVAYPYVLFVSPDGSTVYNVDFYGDIDVYDVAGGTISATWTDVTALSPEFYGGCIDSTGSVMYLVDTTNVALYAVSTVDGSILEQNTTELTDGDAYCEVSPDDSSVFVTNWSVGETDSGDYSIVTTPGQLVEFNASTLALIKTYAMTNVALTEQMQFFNVCTAYVAGYYGNAQTIDLDTGMCAPVLPDTGASASLIIALSSVGGGLVILGVIAVILVRRRSATS